MCRLVSVLTANSGTLSAIDTKPLLATAATVPFASVGHDRTSSAGYRIASDVACFADASSTTGLLPLTALTDAMRAEISSIWASLGMVWLDAVSGTTL